MDHVEQCELDPVPDAPAAAGHWAAERLGIPGAEALAAVLAAAVLTTKPSRILLTITREDGRVRIIAYGSSPVSEDALTPVGRGIVAAFAAAHGVTPEGAGLWAELIA